MVSRLIQQQKPSPETRDALLDQSRALMEDGVAKVPTCLALAHQLQVEAAQVIPGLPPTIPSAQMLMAELTVAGTLLDTGISMYRQAGGSLTDIEGLLKVRAHLSAALFYTNLVLAAPSSGMHSQVLVHVLAAQRESIELQMDEAVAVIEAADAVAGPVTQEEAANSQVQDILLQALYLGPFGSAPSIAP